MSDTRAAADTVAITVDGRELEARPGELVIAAAERNGIYIPRFCWHPRMKPVGMCRMCLVEVEGMRGLPPSCTTPVADGMVVRTTSPAVKKAQDGVLEFLLINHPLDCPVCDRGGECPLQDQTFAFGPGESRFVEEKRHYAKPIAISNLVHLDRERCVLCARCTRFADEVAGDPLISFLERGNETQVLTFPDDPFSSYFSGNTVQICPVGALLAAPYRFRARPWDLEQVESTCTVCAVGCRMAVQSSSNRLVRQLGVDSEPVNHGWLCDKGRFGYEALNSDQRLTTPLLRTTSGAAGERELAPASWAEGLKAVSEGLRSVRDLHGPHSIAVLGGARLTNEDAYAWAKLAKGVLRTDSVDCQLGDGLPAELVLGLPRATIDDACRAPAVVLLAPDLKEELPVLYLRLRKAAVEGGVPLVEVVPRRTGLSPYAASTLCYRPGEAGLVARALVDGGGADTSGVPGRVLAAASELVNKDGVVVVLGRASMAESARSIAEAATVLAGGLPGVRFLPALRRANVHGALDMGLGPGLLPGRVSLDAGRSWYERSWPGLPEQRGLDAHGILAAAAEGKLQGLVLLGADPLSDFPDRALARRALAGAGYVVAVDLFLTESAKWADAVLPAAGYAEKPGTTSNLETRVTRLGQKVTPPGTARPDWMIAVELAARLGADLGFESLDDVSAEIARLAPSHAGITLHHLARPQLRDGVVPPVGDVGEEAPDQAPVPESVEMRAVAAQSQTAGSDLQPAGPPQGVEATPSGPRAEPADDGARPPLLAWEAAPNGPSAPPLDAYSLRLVATRTLYDNGTLNQQSPSLSHLPPGLLLRANSYELDRLGVRTGEEVRVSSARGSLVVRVQADDGVPRGSAAMAFNQPGDGVADLIDASQPVTDVRVETL